MSSMELFGTHAAGFVAGSFHDFVARVGFALSADLARFLPMPELTGQQRCGVEEINHTDQGTQYKKPNDTIS
jgi:hypothetical protein